MKKIFLVTLFLALASVAQAVVITATCNPNPNAILGQNGGSTETCSFSGIPGGAIINSITYEYIFDFQFASFNTGTKTVAFSFTGPSNASFSGTATTGNRPVDSGVQNVTAGTFGLFTGASFSVADAYTGASTAITGGTFSKNFTLTYTPSTVTPEPITYAMMGLGLSLLAIARRK